MVFKNNETRFFTFFCAALFGIGHILCQTTNTLCFAGYTVFLFISVGSFYIWIHSTPLKVDNADVILVLGYKCSNHSVPPLLKERLCEAIQLFQKHNFKKIVVSGGKFSKYELAEAEHMEAYLLVNGISADDIIKEPNARETIGNFIECDKIMKNNHWKTCIVVSNSFHLRRVQWIAQKLDFKCGFHAKRDVRSIFSQFFLTIFELKLFALTKLRISASLIHFDHEKKLTDSEIST